MTTWYLGTLENCGRTIFKIVLPTDDFETIKNGITLIARLLQYFHCLLSLDAYYTSRVFH